MNQVRRRISRLAGGGLARHLRHCRVVQLVVSDVPGDDLASIGSGPLVPDASSPEEALETVARLQLTAALPPRVLEHLRRQTTSGALRTGSGGEAKPEIRTEVIVSNRVALAAAADAAKRLGWTACIRPDPLEGEASDLGRRLAVELGTVGPGPCPSLVIWGGEPAVTLGPDANGTGGRAQELALAAAETLEAEHQEATLILSAGTDGRDGNSDAAGAIVDGDTWQHARAAGVDPREALRTHDSHRALAAARALLRTGPTGTNVMDVVMGLRWA
jgi:glycerate-2-kinase